MILKNLVLVIGLIATGSLMKRSKRFPANTADVLNSYVLNVALPAIILISIPKLPMDARALYPVITHWCAFIVHIALVLLAQKVFRFRKEVFGALLVVTTLGNTAFLGIPMVKTFFGESAIPFAVMYDQLGSAFGFIIYGAFVVPKFTGGGAQQLSTVIKNLFRFPAFLALIGGFVLKVVPMPEVGLHFLSSLAGTLIPAAMIAVGFQMKYKLKTDELKPLAVGLGLKLLILPLLVTAAISGFGISEMSASVSALQSGMPPMVTAGAMAINAGLEKNLSAAYVGYGLIFAFLTLPFIFELL